MNRRRTLLTTTILTIISLVLALITSDSAPIAPERVLTGVVGGVQRTFARVGFGVRDTIRSVRELRRVRDEYAEALEELERLRSAAGRVEALQIENDLLREQLGFAETLPSEAIAARVIAIDAARDVASLTLDRGSRDGVALDAPVVAVVGGRRGLVGRVTEVTFSTSRVTPIYDGRSFVASRMERTRFQGLLSGQGSTSTPLRMEYLSLLAQDQINVGAVVVTSGLNSIYPPGLPVGTVVSITPEEFDASLTATVQPFVDFVRLEYVFVLAPVPAGGEVNASSGARPETSP